jgi:hypothetical protein
MRSRILLGLALAGLLLAAPVARADRAGPGKDRGPEPPAGFRPAVVLRLEALDELFADVRYLLEQAGQQQIGKGVEGALKAMTGGDGGLEGVDTKKPIALYATVQSKLTESQVVLLLPIADEKKFLELLDNLDMKVEKGADGVYTLKIENVPFPILFRFAHGYAYGTPKLSSNIKLPAKDKLPTPATVLAGAGGLLSLTVNADRLPEQVRKLVVSAAALRLGNMKDEQLPGETDAQQELRGSILDELTAQVKSLLEEGGPVQAQLGVDRKKHELALALSVAGQPDTALAKNIAALARAKSVGAALVGKDSAAGGFFHLALPGEVVKKLGPAADEGFKKALGKLDRDTRDLLAPLAKALEATAKAGQVDVGVDLRGPGDSGKYTALFAGKVKDGDRIESALKQVVEKLPEEKRRPIKLNAARAAGVSIHQVTPRKTDDFTRSTLGDGPIYLAVRKDAVLVGMGDGALEALKSALAAEAKQASPLQLELSLGRIAKLIDHYQKGADEAAKKAFKAPGSDRVRLSVTAGKALEVKFSVKSSVLTFAALIEKARRAGDE